MTVVKQYKPSRRQGEAMIDRRLLTYLPFSCSNRRQRAWSLRRQLPGGETLEASASETITVSDILICFALYSLIQDAMLSGIADVKEINGRSYVGVTLRLSSACRRAAGNNNTKEFVAALKRLYSYQCIFTRGGDKQVVTQKYFLDLQVDEKSGVSILVSKETLESLKKQGWIVRVEELRKIKGDRAKALAMWLSQQSGCVFKEITIRELLGLLGAVKKEARKEIRAVLGNLIIAGVIRGGVITDDRVKIERFVQIDPPICPN